MSTLTDKCNGDLVAKDQNLSVSGGESNAEANSAGLDISKAVIQRLESLRLSGLDLIPAGTGQYEFELPELSQSEPAEAQTQSSNSVQESRTNYSGPEASGIEESGIPDEDQPSLAQSDRQSAPAAPAVPTPQPTLLADAYGEPVDVSERDAALKVIEDEVAACTKCEELCQLRNQTVFGVGTSRTRLVFVGEGPGAEEDRKGEPFVGAAGQLLDKILGACGLARSEVYILNTVKCRPPGNRNPSQDELANCWGYAERQLEVMQPEFICCLGSVAAKTVLKSTQSLGRLRKRFHQYRGSKVLVTYHPAYLLRTPSAKKHVWEDMKMLMKEMGIEISK